MGLPPGVRGLLRSGRDRGSRPGRGSLREGEALCPPHICQRQPGAGRGHSDPSRRLETFELNMYLFNELHILPLLLLFLLWGAGGWLLTLRWFDVEPHERGLIGFGLGLVIANWSGNFLARFLPLSLAFWAAALLTLALGIFSAWPLNRDLFPGWQKIRWM